MKHTIYEDPITRKFAILTLPVNYADGDRVPVPPTVRWFGTQEEAVAALPLLLNEDEMIV